MSIFPSDLASSNTWMSFSFGAYGSATGIVAPGGEELLDCHHQTICQMFLI